MNSDIACAPSEHSNVDTSNIYLSSITYYYMFNGPSSGTTQVSRHQKGKTNLDFTEARDK